MAGPVVTADNLCSKGCRSATGGRGGTVDAADLKSASLGSVGSSPTVRTILAAMHLTTGPPKVASPRPRPKEERLEWSGEVGEAGCEKGLRNAYAHSYRPVYAKAARVKIS